MLETGLYNMDCMDGMKMFPDKFFDLAIVDPPYGNAANTNKSGLAGGAADWNGPTGRFGGRFSRYDLSDGRDMGGEIQSSGYL